MASKKAPQTRRKQTWSIIRKKRKIRQAKNRPAKKRRG